MVQVALEGVPSQASTSTFERVFRRMEEKNLERMRRSEEVVGWKEKGPAK